ncbi:response regulator protein VraR [Mariprofundus micogutta]|uniref:Response regulator protein VraR n=1 Tax=Mariprofundus micogutta TaxID=1921010 RepID=A0A1L8CKI8_9PROT|nr:LuxR C-terminal-related transcriptional regulator [Mariprofundus micogutta]GAV19379.1 response regulator protein VraR [Mariprofundus micogutta]
MEQQSVRFNKLQQVKSQLGVYQLLLQSSLNEPASQTPSELLTVYKTLLSMKEAIASHIVAVESHLTKPVQASTSELWHRSRTIEKLSCREMDVLHMFAKGYSYNETASALNCQLTTIQTHTKRIYKKLNVHSRSEAVFEASQLGLLII